MFTPSKTLTLVSLIVITNLMNACAKKKSDDDSDAAEAAEAAETIAPATVAPASSAPASTDPADDVAELGHRPYGFECAPDQDHSDDAPLFTRPFDPDFFNLDGSPNPKGAMGQIGGIFMTNGELGHIMPTVHNYSSLKSGVKIPVYALAAGTLVRVVRTAGNEYHYTLAHSCSLMSYMSHLAYLRSKPMIAAIAKIIPDWDADGAAWEISFGDVMDSKDGNFYRSTAIIDIARGAHVAEKDSAVRNTALDIGVLDARRDSGRVINPTKHTYQNTPLLDTLEAVSSVHFAEYLGLADRTLFASYLDQPAAKKVPAVDVSEADFGSTGKDIAGTLNGIWFNPAVYEQTAPGKDRDYAQAAALVIYNDAMFTNAVRVAFATQAAGTSQDMDSFGQSLIKLDPAGWQPCGCDEAEQACVLSCLNKQKRLTTFQTPFSSNTALRATTSDSADNLAPNLVDETSGVTCYDLQVTNGTTYNQIYLQMAGANELHVKFVPTGAATKQCGTETGITMNADYFTYVRGADVL